MANYSILFHDSNDLKTVECWGSKTGEVRVVIKEEDPNGKEINVIGIDLDISTSIKFAKTLRTEINKAKEVQNG